VVFGKFAVGNLHLLETLLRLRLEAGVALKSIGVPLFGRLAIGLVNGRLRVWRLRQAERSCVLKALSAGTGHSLGFRRQGVEGGAGFFEEQAIFGFLLFEAFDHRRRGFLQESLVAELPLGGGHAFFVFGDVFGVAFAFGGDIDGALVDYGDYKITSVAPLKFWMAVAGSLVIPDLANFGHPGEPVEVSFNSLLEQWAQPKMMGTDTFSSTPISLRRESNSDLRVNRRSI